MNDIEEDGGGSATAGNQEEDGFARMMKEFNQDAEEKEHEATEEEENQEEEEANTAVAPKIPIKPSQEEVDAHMLTHLPFRSWCPHCVRGKSKGKAHRKQTGTAKEIPTVSLDYMFMHGNQEEDEEKGMPILQAFSKVTSALLSWCVQP